jgi:hypothetical protein
MSKRRHGGIAEPLALRRPINGEPAEAKHRHVVTAETFLRESGRAAVFERRGAQRVEAEDARRCVDRRGDEAFRAAAFVVLAGVALQIEVEIGIAAIEGGALSVDLVARADA